MQIDSKPAGTKCNLFQLPDEYHSTSFYQVNPAECDGRVLPTWCSGLAIISRFPFVKEVEFLSFSSFGILGDVAWDWTAAKGAARVVVEPLSGVQARVLHLILYM